MRKRERLALPILPPTTLDARKYFFSKISSFTDTAAATGKKKIDFLAFCQEWNQTADGQTRFYITPELLALYAKSWEKISNIRATEELMREQLDSTKASARIFAAEDRPLPDYLTTTPFQLTPRQGLLPRVHEEVQCRSGPMPNTNPAPPQTLPVHQTTPSRDSSPVLPTPQPMSPMAIDEASTNSDHSPPVDPLEGPEPKRRRREVPEEKRVRKTVRKCRRCHRTTCPGGNDIRRCPYPCTVPCKMCGQLQNCTGVDNGKMCSIKKMKIKV